MIKEEEEEVEEQVEEEEEEEVEIVKRVEKRKRLGGNTKSSLKRAKAEEKDGGEKDLLFDSSNSINKRNILSNESSFSKGSSSQNLPGKISPFSSIASFSKAPVKKQNSKSSLSSLCSSTIGALNSSQSLEEKKPSQSYFSKSSFRLSESDMRQKSSMVEEMFRHSFTSSPSSEGDEEEEEEENKVILSEEQQKVMDLAMEGKSFFFTGSAGTGFF